VESWELATLEWVTWFNHQRLPEPIGYIPPAEAEDQYDLQLTARAEYVCTQTTGPLRNPGRFILPSKVTSSDVTLGRRDFVGTSICLMLSSAYSLWL